MKFWSETWSAKKEHGRNGEWLGNICYQLGNEKQRDLKITTQSIQNQFKKMSQRHIQKPVEHLRWSFLRK